MLLLARCEICGWTALDGACLCVSCWEIREWSRVNRAFCDLIHRPPQPAVAHRRSLDPRESGVLVAGRG